MRFIHGVSGLLLLAILIAGGGGAAYVAWQGPEAWTSMLDTMKLFRMSAWVGGAGTLALVVFFLISYIRPKRHEQMLRLKTKSGVVRISIEAARNLIEKIGEEFAAVISMRVQLTARGSVPRVSLDMRLRAGAEVPELCRMLQERIRETLETSLGIRKVRSIEINVKEITGSLPPDGAESEDAEVLRETGYDV